MKNKGTRLNTPIVSLVSARKQTKSTALTAIGPRLVRGGWNYGQAVSL
jgi:acetate kinase